MSFQRAALSLRHPQAKQDRSVGLRDYLDIVVKQWVLVVAAMVCGMLLGLAVAMLATPRYEATSTLYVSVRSADAGSVEGLMNGANFLQASMTSYADVATTTLVLDDVAEELELDMSAGQLANALEVRVPNESVLLKITATHTQPELARDIANTTADVLTTVVEDEIGASSDGQTGPVQVRTVDSAPLPVEPTNPSGFVTGMFGGVIGLIAGVSLAVMRHFADTRMHSTKELEHITGLPILGRIPEDDHIAQRPLIVHDDPHTPRAEAYRIVRTNLQFLRIGDGPKTILVSSAIPGEGKTHMAANLGIVLAESGARVTLVDADFRKPRLADVMGIEGAAGLSDVLVGRAELADVLQPWGFHQLWVLPAGQRPPNPSELLGSRAMEHLVADLKAETDYLIIDSPPILPVTDAAVVSPLTSGTLLVASLGHTRKSDLEQAISQLNAVGDYPLGVIANRVPVKVNGVYGTYGATYHQTSGKISRAAQ